MGFAFDCWYVLGVGLLIAWILLCLLYSSYLLFVLFWIGRFCLITCVHVACVIFSLLVGLIVVYFVLEFYLDCLLVWVC